MFKEILPTLQEVNPKWTTLPKNEVSTKFKLHQAYIDYFRRQVKDKVSFQKRIDQKKEDLGLISESDNNDESTSDHILT